MSQEANPLKLDFSQFVDWATGYVTFGIGRGESLRNSLHVVLDHAVRNEVFGKEKREIEKLPDDILDKDRPRGRGKRAKLKLQEQEQICRLIELFEGFLNLDCLCLVSTNQFASPPFNR